MTDRPGNGEPATDDPATRQHIACVLMGAAAGAGLALTIAAALGAFT